VLTQISSKYTQYNNSNKYTYKLKGNQIWQIGIIIIISLCSKCCFNTCKINNKIIFYASDGPYNNKTILTNNI